MPTESEFRSRRDSWPPTLLHLSSNSSISSSKATQGDPTPLLDIDEDPLTYFLTPTPSVEDDDDFDEPMFDIDAGIEEEGFGHEVIRSISPSTLDGLAKYKPTARGSPRRGYSPDMDTDSSAAEDDDDEEYIRFPPRPIPQRLLSLEERRPHRPRSPLSSFSFPAPSSTPYSSSPHSSSPRGRSRFAPRSPPRRQFRPGHLWREPSPDVWSIEEEDEPIVSTEKGKEKEAAKPGNGKKVRFVLPVEN